MPLIRWIVILSLLQVVPFWRIFRRMGLPPWLAIMASVPLVNLIVRPRRPVLRLRRHAARAAAL
jgi:hypothetical protein